MMYCCQTISWPVGKQRTSKTFRLTILVLHATKSEDAQLGVFEALWDPALARASCTLWSGT